ncbi:tyrosine-type recombinase/integrase [Kribbella solani]|uniref:tyrosine-type recombinase/integrase n=2 Tax=Kribbella solani TaxID=236067 RepID=UPI0029AD76CD|nr:tyrosine-type recombinase/integrase [Kribbella solani]MDX3005202.1 tyrosine-type recombinase/integrase [Kribbella solani]
MDNLPAPLVFRPDETAVELPPPDPTTEAAVRRTLGSRRPLRTSQSATSVDRLDLLAAALTPELTALVVLWLGGTRRGSRDTRIAYADDLLLWADWACRELGRERFGLDLRRGDVTMWLTGQQDAGAADSSISRRLSTLSSLYRYAASWGLPVVSPISVDDHRPRIERGRRATSARVLVADQVMAMLAAASDVRDALVVGLLFTDALRVSGICAANDDDRRDEGRRTWLKVTVKGGKTKLVPLQTTVAELLDQYLTMRPAWTGPGPAPLIVDAAGQRIDRHDVTRMLRRLARAAGIPRPEKVTPHSLRASAVTDQKRRGLAAEDIQELTIHADVRTVMIYVDDDGRNERVAAITDDLGRVMTAVPTHLRHPTRPQQRRDHRPR